MMMRFRSLCVAAMIAMASSSVHADILLNSGFEDGTAGNADHWTEIAGASGTTVRSSDQPHSGSFSAYMAFDHINNPAAGDAYFIEQVQGVNSIDNSLNYNLSFWAKSESSDFTGTNMFFQLQWLDQDNSDGGGVKGETLISLVANGLNTDYRQFEFNDLDAADGSDSFLIRFQVAAGAVDNIANGMYVDTVRFSAVPEPGSVGIMALCGLAFFFRRGERTSIRACEIISIK